MIHVVTGEYPPARGGVADYTAEIAAALARAGEPVHVWCPGDARAPEVERGVVVHRALGAITSADLRRVDAELDAYPAPRRILLQWVPHAFAQRSMNLGFCRWIGRRAAGGDRVEIMVHEPFLPFSARLKPLVAAAVHRVMTVTLLRAAQHVWLATPAWARMWQPYAIGRPVPFTWLPEPASVPVDAAAAPAASRIRARLVRDDGSLIGSFCANSPFARETLVTAMPPVLDARPSAALLLIGAGSTGTRDALVEQHPALASRMHATGTLDAGDISAHLAACDLAVQPYPDGICTRHSSAMTVLAHGVPMVTTTGRFTEEIWRESGGVALVAANDHRAFGAAVERLLSAAAERTAQRQRALELYDSRFDVRHTVAALLRPAGGLA